MNCWTVGATGGRGDAVGPGTENGIVKLVELLVETDVSGRQMKVADVVTASVVVAVGVGTYAKSSQLIRKVKVVRGGEVTYRGASYGSESINYQRAACTVNRACRRDGRGVDGARSIQWQLEDWLQSGAC